MKTPDDHSTWEIEMGDEFERRVRNLHEAPIDLSSVKGTAMTIRRKRRVALAGGILAAAAVIVPVAILATNGASDRADSIDPAGPSVTISDTSNPTPIPSPTAVETSPGSTLPDDISVGFDYLEVGSGDAVLHQRDGGMITLPGADYSDAATLGSTIAAYRIDDAGDGFVDLVEDGGVVTTYDVRSSMATAPDGLTVAFVTTDDELVFVNAEQGEQSFGDIDGDTTLAAIVGDGDCTLESGCHPFLEYENFEKGMAFEINYEGPTTSPAPGALLVNDADDSFLVSVITSIDDDQSCGGLYDREGGGAWVFQTCKYQVHEISPSGDYVIGLPSYFDGLGPLDFSLLDDQGAEVATKRVDGVVGDLAWADETHAVATVYSDGQWQIISLGIDGTEEVLVEGAPGDELSSPYRITGQG